MVRSLVKTAGELCERTLRKDEDRKERKCPLTDREHLKIKLKRKQGRTRLKEKGDAENLGSCLE